VEEGRGNCHIQKLSRPGVLKLFSLMNTVVVVVIVVLLPTKHMIKMSTRASTVYKYVKDTIQYQKSTRLRTPGLDIHKSVKNISRINTVQQLKSFNLLKCV
jgi:hypothetical protein